MPCSRREFVRKMRALGYDGPFAAAGHEVMIQPGRPPVRVPNPHTGQDVSADLLSWILRVARIDPYPAGPISRSALSTLHAPRAARRALTRRRNPSLNETRHGQVIDRRRVTSATTPGAAPGTGVTTTVA